MFSTISTAASVEPVGEETKAMITLYLKAELHPGSAALNGIKIFIQKLSEAPTDIRRMVARDAERRYVSATEILAMFAAFHKDENVVDQRKKLPNTELRRFEGFLVEDVRARHLDHSRIMYRAILNQEKRPYRGLSQRVLQLTEEALQTFVWHDMRRRWEPHVQRLRNQGRTISEEYYEVFFTEDRDWSAAKLEFVVLTTCFTQLVWQGVRWGFDGSPIPPAIYLMMDVEDEINHIRGLQEMHEFLASERLGDLKRDCNFIFHLLVEPLKRLRDELVAHLPDLQNVRITNEYSFMVVADEEKGALHVISSPSVKSSENCAICLEPHGSADWVKTNTCSHIFGRKCLETWLGAHDTCPMCRTIFHVNRDDLRQERLLEPRYSSPLNRPILTFLSMCRSLANMGEIVREILHPGGVANRDLAIDTCRVLITTCGLLGDIRALSHEFRQHMKQLGVFRIDLPGLG
jgi:hypothetical protein